MPAHVLRRDRSGAGARDATRTDGPSRCTPRQSAGSADTSESASHNFEQPELSRRLGGASEMREGNWRVRHVVRFGEAHAARHQRNATGAERTQPERKAARAKAPPRPAQSQTLSLSTLTKPAHVTLHTALRILHLRAAVRARPHKRLAGVVRHELRLRLHLAPT